MVWCGIRRGQDQAGIDGDGTAFRDDHRIKVDLGDIVGEIEEKTIDAADLQHHVDEGIDGNRRPAARSAEQGRALKFAEHFTGIPFADRTQTEGDVGQDLDEDAAEPDHDHRSETRIADTADDDFLARRRHLLDQVAVDRPPQDALGRGHRGNGVGHRTGCLETDTNTTGVAFVENFRRHHLDHERRRHGGAGRGGAIGAVDDRRERHGNGVGAEDLLGGGFVQSLAIGRAGRRDAGGNVHAVSGS